MSLCTYNWNYCRHIFESELIFWFCPFIWTDRHSQNQWWGSSIFGRFRSWFSHNSSYLNLFEKYNTNLYRTILKKTVACFNAKESKVTCHWPWGEGMGAGGYFRFMVTGKYEWRYRFKCKTFLLTWSKTQANSLSQTYSPLHQKTN